MDNSFKAKTTTVSASMALGHKPERIFPLLCPVREYEWIEHWKCELLFTESGFNEMGCIFKTDFPEFGEETWVTSRYEPTKYVEFVRTSADKVLLYSIALDESANQTNLTWSLKLIGTTGKGNRWIKSYNPDEFRNMIGLLEKKLDYYLTHGEMYHEANNHADSR